MNIKDVEFWLRSRYAQPGGQLLDLDAANAVKRVILKLSGFQQDQKENLRNQCDLQMRIDALKGAASAEYSRGVKDGAKAERVELVDVPLNLVAWIEAASLPDLKGTVPAWTAAWNSPTWRHPVALVTLESAQQAAQHKVEQPHQEPVAWAISYDGKTPYKLRDYSDGALLDAEIAHVGGTASKMPLYAASKQAAQLTDLTERQIVDGARELCRIHAEQCQVDEIDVWTHYSDDFKSDFTKAVFAAQKGKA